MKDWDSKSKRVKKSYPNSTRLNNFLIKKLSEVNDKVLELQKKKDFVSLNKIKNTLKKFSEYDTFSAISQKYINELIANNKFSRLDADGPRIKCFIAFAGCKNLSFEEINESLLKRFMTYLKVERKNSERTVVNNLVIIRTLFNRAIREGIVSQKLYLFVKEK